MIIGICDDGTVQGHDAAAVHRLNQLIGSASSELVRPAINPTTENVSVSTDVVIVVTVPDGISKPYNNMGRVLIRPENWKFQELCWNNWLLTP
ncbi:MAG TPA: ATP-binding protein [Candidatus Acidoferrum sp.]|nr:ATP-binding protein [Candidatus Acidoferrum sp.]